MNKSYKAIQVEVQLYSVVPDAVSEIESLRDEMQDTVDNMEGANMEHLPKYEAACEAVNQLETAIDNLYGIEDRLKEVLGDKGHGMVVKYLELKNIRKKPCSRAVRASNAGQPLQSLLDLLKHEGHYDALTEELDSMEAAIDELSSVEFPGMFG